MMKRFAGLAAAALLAASPMVRAEPKTVTLEVSNMFCPLCPITVKTAITKVPGVLDAKVDYPSRTAVVRFESEQTSVEAITAATKNAGYPSRPAP